MWNGLSDQVPAAWTLRSFKKQLDTIWRELGLKRKLPRRAKQHVLIPRVWHILIFIHIKEGLELSQRIHTASTEWASALAINKSLRMKRLLVSSLPQVNPSLNKFISWLHFDIHAEHLCCKPGPSFRFFMVLIWSNCSRIATASGLAL